MLTKKDAILIAETFAKAAKHDIEASRQRGNQDEIHGIRGALFRGLDDFWYDLLPMKVREQFDVVSNMHTGRYNFVEYASVILDN